MMQTVRRYLDLVLATSRMLPMAAALGLAAQLVLTPGAATAQSVPATGSGSVTAPVPGQSDVRSVTIPDIQLSTDVTGFRTAKFGQSEAEVRAAVVKDFKLRPDAIHLIESSTEKTRALVVRVPDVIPVQGSGTAEISYVLGHGSGRLIQVSLVWSKATDPKLTPDQLVANAALLNEYFRARAITPSEDRGLAPLSDGRFLLFRGKDAQKRTVMLIARGPLQANSDGSRSVVVDTLWLYYIQNFDNPDVFRLPPGSF